MAIRWVIQDRADVNAVYTVGQPSNAKERDNLKALIKNTSKLGVVRGGK